MENTQRVSDSTPRVETAAPVSRGVPADWFLDPADPQSRAWGAEASLEDQATAFLSAHGLDEDAAESPAPERSGTVTALFPQTPVPPVDEAPTSTVWDAQPLIAGMDEVEGELAWQVDALCAQTDPEAFFPEKGGSTRDAKKICGSCPVRAECLDYAMAHDERFGIWGGMSERERRRLRKLRG